MWQKKKGKEKECFVIVCLPIDLDWIWVTFEEWTSNKSIGKERKEKDDRYTKMNGQTMDIKRKHTGTETTRTNTETACTNEDLMCRSKDHCNHSQERNA